MFDLYLYDDIEPGSASKIVDGLAKAGGGEVTLHVNCYGGDVFEGKTIMHRLRDYSGSVTAVVEGVAASAASFIVAGGADRVIMREGSRMMVHNALSSGIGNANDFDKLSEQLRGQSNDIAEIYAGKSGAPVDAWISAMDSETWFTAEEAVAAGLADAVESGREAKAVAMTTSRVMNTFMGRRGSPPDTLLRRRDAPSPTINRPSGQKGEGMSFLNELAQKMGKTEEQVLAALGRVMNEEVTVTSTVEVAYPEGTTVVPTGKATVEPVGDLPPGLVFAVGEVPEGWSAEVDEATGVLTVTAPAGAEPDAEVTVPVTVSGEGAAVVLQVVIAVKAAAAEAAPAGAPAPAAPPAGPETVTLDRDTYNDLVAAARNGWAAKNKADADSRRKQVDSWIREGRINSAHRAKVIKAMDRDETAARELYGSIPRNTIPVREIGHGIAEEESDGVPTAESLRALSASRKSGK